MVVPFCIYPLKVLDPSEESLHFPTSSVSPKWSSILGLRFLPVGLMRRNRFDANGGNFRVQGIAVACFVSNYPLPKIHYIVNQRRFMRGSTVHVEGVRKTMAVRQGLFFCWREHHVEKGLPDIEPASILEILGQQQKYFLKYTVFGHFWCKRWLVWYGGYRSERPYRCAPMRRIRRMLSSTSRGWRCRRSRGTDRLDTGGLKSSNCVHCSSVKSIQQNLGTNQKITGYFEKRYSNVAKIA